MPITAQCSCGKKFQAKDELAGKRVKCPGCGQPLAIPDTKTKSAAAVPTKPVNKSAGQPAAPKPTAKKPAPAALDPLGSLEALEQAAGAINNPLGMPGGNPLGNPMGNPLGTANPLGMGNPMLGAYGAAPRKSGPNPVMLVGIGAGVLGVLVLAGIGIVIAMSGGKDDPPGVTDPNTLAQASPTNETDTGSGNDASPTDASSDVSPQPVPLETPRPSEPETPAESPQPANRTPTSLTPVEPDSGSSTPSRTPSGVPSNTPPSGANSAGNSKQDWKTLGVALHQRFDKSTDFPGVLQFPDKPIVAGYSWMFDLLPYLGHNELHGKFDTKRSWTEKENIGWVGNIVPEFLNPADPRKQWKGYPYDQFALTHFVGMSGIETSRNEVAATFPRSDPRAGMFGYDEIARPRQVTDGTSNTIMLLGSGEMAAPWIQGGGGTIRGAREPYFDEISGFGSRGLAKPGTHVMFADGSVRVIPATISPQVFRALCTIHGAKTVDHAALSASGAGGK